MTERDIKKVMEDCLKYAPHRAKYDEVQQKVQQRCNCNMVEASSEMSDITDVEDNTDASDIVSLC